MNIKKTSHIRSSNMKHIIWVKNDSALCFSIADEASVTRTFFTQKNQPCYVTKKIKVQCVDFNT